MMKKSHNPDSQADDTSLENRVYRLEIKVVEMLKYNIQAAIDKSIEARLKQIDPPKDVPDFGKMKLEKAIYNQKDKLYRMMEKVKAFKRHPAHKALFDALAVSLIFDDDDMDLQDDQPSQKKRRRDDYDKDPFAGADKDSKKRQKKPDSSKNDKDQVGSSKKGKLSSKPSISNKPVDADEFSTLEKSAKAPEDFDDVLGSTFDFSNFMKHRLKKDRLTKADLEGPVFELFNGTCRSSIELEYHLEQCYLAFSDELDWTNPEGNRNHQDFSKPLPLHNTDGRLYIPVEFFFNKDLEYLRSRNLEERKYTTSIIKTKATRSHWGPKRKLYLRARLAIQSDHTVYSRMKTLSFVRIFVEKQCGYGYLKEIVVKRAIKKEYMFKEADFPTLHLNDIEDMFLLYYQNKLHHLDGNVQTDLAAALWFFIRRTIIKHRVKDV
ncbi:hypothetical protein Tco_0796299 [Tanacetum coccineum]